MSQVFTRRTPETEALQQEQAATSVMDQQAAEQDFIVKQQKDAQKAQQAAESAAADAARAQKAQISAAQKAGVKIQTDEAGQETMARHEDGAPLYESGFTSEPQQGKNGPAVSYRDPRGKQYEVPVSAINRTTDPTGSPFYEFTLPTGERVRQPEDKAKPLFKVDPATGQRYTEAPDTKTGSFTQTPLGLDRDAAAKAAIEKRKLAAKQQEDERSFKAGELRLMQDQQQTALKPVKDRLDIAADAFDKLEKAKTRYEKRPEGIVSIQKFGDEEIASPIDSNDATRLSTAQAWIEQHNRTKQELEAAKAAHDPIAATIQEMQVRRDKLAIDTLHANRREALELEQMERAAKAGIPVHEADWKKRLVDARKDPRIVDTFTKAALADAGSPLADDVERVSLSETGKLMSRVLNTGMTGKTMQPGQGVLQPGEKTPLTRPKPTLKETILENLAADNLPATGKDANALATEALGITDPEKWSVTTNEQGTHDLSRDGQLVGTVDTRNNQIRLFPPTSWEQENEQVRITQANQNGLPIYYMGGGQPMRPQELRDYIQSGFDIAGTTKDPVELETKLAAAGLSPDAIRRNVLDGRLSVQDGRMLAEQFHGIQQVDTTEAGTRKAFGEWLTKPENRTQAAMFQNGDAAQKADVVSSFFDQHASQAATGNLLPNREGLAAQREAMLKPYTEKGVLAKAGGFVKELIMPMIGIGAQATALPFQEALHLFGAETEAGKLSNEEFSNWLKRSSGFLHRINTRNELDRPLGDLEAWMNKANPGDEVPQELADKIAAAAFDTYHQLTPDAAKDLNTTRDTFDVNKDPALRGIVQNYLQTANPSARASLLGMLTMDAKDRETQKKVMAYIAAPRTATAGEAQERAALAGVTLTPEKAGQLLALGKQLESVDSPAKAQNLVKQAGGIMGLSDPTDIKTAFDLITRQTSTSPDSAWGLTKGGFVAGRQELATEALTTAAEVGVGFLTAGAATPEILAERAARQGIVSGARAALRRTLTAGLDALSAESKMFAAARGRIGQARRALGADLTKQADEFAKLGIVQPKFGAPLTTGQKARNIAVAGVKAGAVAAPMEGLEEGFAAIGETDPNLDSLVQQIGMGAAGGMVLGPLFTGGGVAAQAWKNRGLEARMGELKTKWAEDFNKNMAGVAGFKPMRPEDFDVAMGVMNTPEHAAARESFVGALAELQAAAQEHAASPASRLRMVQARLTELEKQHGPRERPIGGIVANGMEPLRIETAEERRLLAEQAKLIDDPASIQGKSPRLMAAEARAQKAGNDLAAASTFAFEAADELRQLPADQQPLYTGIAKAVSGAREFTEAEAKALIGLQGENAVAFQQAMPADIAGPPSSTRTAPNVTQTGPGRYTLPEGVSIAVPPQALAMLAERAPSLLGALGRSQSVVTNPTPAANENASTNKPKSARKTGNATNPSKNATAGQGGNGENAAVETELTPKPTPWANAGVTTPVDGLWRSQNGDIPVRVVGQQGDQVETISDDGKLIMISAKEVMPVKATGTPKAPKTPSTANTGAQTAPQAGQIAPKAHENIARQVIGAVAAKSPKLKKLIQESKQPSTMQSGGMWTGFDGTIVFHMPSLVKQLDGLDAKTAAKRVEAILDEEIRHSANLEAARRLYKRGGTNPLNLPFEQWREAWYGDIWNNHFTDAMRQQVKDAYGDTLPKEDWMRAMEGLRMLDQLRATDSITEAVLRHLEAVLQALREFLAAATPKIKAEIQAIQAILIEFGYEQGAVKPEKAKKKVAAKKSPPVSKSPAKPSPVSPTASQPTANAQGVESDAPPRPLVVPILKPTTPPRPAESADAAYLKAQEDTRAALGGLFSAPALKRSIPQLEVSEERFDAVRKAAVSIIAAKIRTPQAFAKFMDDTFPGGKARPYSEAIWDLMGIADKTLRGTHDWSAIYAEIDTPAEVQEPVSPEATISPEAKSEQGAAPASYLERVLDAAIKDGMGELTIPVPEKNQNRDDLQKAIEAIQARGLQASTDGKNILVRGFRELAPASAKEQDEQDESPFMRERNATIKASKEAGNVHLDAEKRYVENSRGREIYNVHDPKERGIIRTVSNQGEVVVHWSDKYSGEKNLATAKTEQRGRKKVDVLESWLMPTDLVDYVFADSSKPAPQAKADTPASGLITDEESARLDALTVNNKDRLDKLSGNQLSQLNKELLRQPSSAKRDAILATEHPDDLKAALDVVTKAKTDTPATAEAKVEESNAPVTVTAEMASKWFRAYYGGNAEVTKVLPGLFKIGDSLYGLYSISKLTDQQVLNGVPFGDSQMLVKEEDDAATDEETPQQRLDALYRSTTLLAADSPEQLRTIDVDRVLSAIPEADRPGYRAWLIQRNLTNKPLVDALMAWTPEVSIDTEPDILKKAAEIGALQDEQKARAQIYNAGAKEDAAGLIGMSPEAFYNLPYERWSAVDRIIQAFRNEAQEQWEGSDTTPFSEIWSKYAEDFPAKIRDVKWAVQAVLREGESPTPTIIPERGDTVTWTDGAGKPATATVDKITTRDGTQYAWLEWFGTKEVPLDQLTVKTKSGARLAREKREAEAANIPVKEVTTPEPVKEKKPADNKALKEMKRFLLEKLDDAIAEAPDGRITPSAYSGRVVIEIPGDGTFTLVNEKKVLQEFAKRAKGFPTTTPSATYPKPTAIRPSSIPALNKAKLSKMDMVKVAGTFASTDETRMNIMQVVDVGDTLVATNGKYLFMAPFEGQGTAEDPMLYTAKGGQIGPQSKHEEDFGKYPDWKVVVPKDAQVLHTGIDTGRLWQILKQASAVFRDVNFQVKNGSGTFDDAVPYVDLFLNPDGSVAVVGEVENGKVGRKDNVDRYEHNLQEGAQSIGRFDASLFMDILAAMRALGQEKVSFRSEADMSQGALVVSSPVADVILMRVRTQAATNAAHVEAAQAAMTPTEETAAAPVEWPTESRNLTLADTARAAEMTEAEIEAAATPVLEALRELEAPSGVDQAGIAKRGGSVYDEALEGKFSIKELAAAHVWLRRHNAYSVLMDSMEYAIARDSSNDALPPPKASGLRTQADTIHAGRSPAELLALAAPYEQQGPDYNRNIAESAARLRQSVERGDKFVQLNADELAVRLEKWAPEANDSGTNYANGLPKPPRAALKEAKRLGVVIESYLHGIYDPTPAFKVFATSKPDRIEHTVGTTANELIRAIRIVAESAGHAEETANGLSVKDPSDYRESQRAKLQQEIDDRLNKPKVADPNTPLFDEDYKGPRFTYGLRNRPLSTGAQPKGWIIGSNRANSNYLHGTVDYPRELTADELSSYELEPITRAKEEASQSIEQADMHRFSSDLNDTGVAYVNGDRYAIKQANDGTYYVERTRNGQREELATGFADIAAANRGALEIVSGASTTAPSIIPPTPAQERILAQLPTAEANEAQKKGLGFDRPQTTSHRLPNDPVIYMDRQGEKRLGYIDTDGKPHMLSVEESEAKRQQIAEFEAQQKQQLEQRLNAMRENARAQDEKRLFQPTPSGPAYYRKGGQWFEHGTDRLVGRKKGDGSVLLTLDGPNVNLYEVRIVSDNGAMHFAPVSNDTKTVSPETPAAEVVTTPPAEEQPAPQVPPAKRAKKSAAKIEDFGEKIGGARKDTWKERGLGVADFDNLSDTEKQAYTVKPQVFPKPDYQAWIDGGMPRELAYALKEVYDAITPKPNLTRAQQADPAQRDAALRLYVEFVSKIRDALPKITNLDELKALRGQLLPSDGRGMTQPEARAALELASKTRGNRYTLGGKMTPSSYDLYQYKQELEQNTAWPASQESWQRMFSIRKVPVGTVTSTRLPDGTYERKEVTAETPDNWQVIKSDGRWNVIVSDGHATREEAEAVAKRLAESKKGDKGGPLKRPLNPDARRVGPDYRNGRDVTGQDLLDTFGFRGGEFGNWTNEADRQQSLNQAYDGLLDLARVLNLPPKALSLNGELGIAFGARGSGKASAHYEPAKVVINLTRTSGAGALAHEWAHAVDDYFGRMVTKGQIGKYVSHGVKGSADFRAELAEAINAVMKAIDSRQTTAPEYIESLKTRNAEAKKALESWLKSVERVTAKLQLSQDSKNAVLELQETLLGNKLPQIGEGGRPNMTAVATEMLTIYALQAKAQKEHISWPVTGGGKMSDLASGLGRHAGAIHFTNSELAKAEAGTIEIPTRMVETSFLKESKEQGDYWQRRHELFARAFEAFVEDSIRLEGNASPYLVQSTFDSGAWGSLYPQGDERTATNEALRKMAATFKTRDTEKGVALFSAPRYQSPPGLAETARQARGLNSPASLASIIQKAYAGVKRGSSSVMVPIRAVYMVAKAAHPEMTMPDFLAAVKAADERGDLALEAANSTQEQQSHEPFVVPSMSGPGIRMVWTKDEGLASAPASGQTTGMASASGAAQNAEPSPGGLSEAGPFTLVQASALPEGRFGTILRKLNLPAFLPHNEGNWWQNMVAAAQSVFPGVEVPLAAMQVWERLSNYAVQDQAAIEKAWRNEEWIKEAGGTIGRLHQVIKNAKELQQLMVATGRAKGFIASKWQETMGRLLSYDGPVYRGETAPPTVVKIQFLRDVEMPREGAYTGHSSSGLSNSFYPRLAAVLSNGAVVSERIRISDHPQVSENAPRRYEIDLRATEQQLKKKAFRQVVEEQEDRVVRLLNDLVAESWDGDRWKAQKSQSRAESRSDMPGRGPTNLATSKTGQGDSLPSSVSVNPESSRAAGGTLSSAPAPDPKAAAIKEAVATMPPMWREALELSMKGTPPEEIATRMNLSETAVGHILRTAQGRLRILLEAGEGKLKPTVRVEDEKVKAAGGRPDLAMSGKAAFAAVDQRRRTPEEVTHGEMEALAQRLFATDAAAAENLVVRWMDSGTTVLSTEGMPEAIKAIVAEAQARSAAEMLMTAAAKLLVTEKALAGGNAIQMARLIDLYRNTGTEQARALNMRYDPHATPEERAAMYLSEALLTPPEAMRNEIRRNPANKERILAAWAAEAEKLKEQLKAEGYDIDATFRELAKEKRLAEAAIPQEVKIPLAKASSKTRRLVKAVLEGMSWGDAAKAASLSFEAARKAYMEFRDSINNAGVQAAQQAKDALLRSAPAADFAAQLGLPEWLENASPDFVPVKTEATKALKEQRTKKKAGGEIDLKDPVSARRVISKIAAAKSTAFDKISEYWRASILSGPQTHVVNVVSGVTFGLYESTFKKLATATQADIARMFGMKPDAASLSDIPGMLSAVLPSIKQAFANGLRAWKEDSRVFDAYAMQVLDDQGGVFKEQSHAAIKGKKGAIIRSPFRLMGMADEFVKSFFTRIEVAAQARQIARNENLTGEAFRLRIAELMEPGSLAWERALGGAKRITFQNEEVSVNGAPIKLGGPLASGSRAIDAIDGAANLIKRTKKGDFGGLLRGLSHFIFPFVDTPTNIFKMGVQMSPVGGLLSVIDAVRYYNLRRKGNNEQAQKIYNAARAFDDLANQIVAWGFILALSELVKPGDDDEETPWITGTLPWRTTAPGEREIAYRVAPPQSIRIGGQWISYKRLDPFASALAFTVDAIKEFGSGRPIDETWGNVGLNMMRNMQDKTFLQGVSDLFNAINDPERFGTKWAVNIATGFVPNLIRQPVRTADPLIRESDIPNDMGLWDALARRVGYSVLPQSAMPAIDVWGREQAKNTGTGGPNTDWVLRLFSPADMKDADGVDYLDVALLRYNMAHDKPFGVAAPSREIQKTINGKPVRVSLDDAEYDDMARKAGKAARAAIGDRFKGRDLTENDVELIKDIISRSQGVYRDAAFTSAFQKRGLAATSK